MAAAPDPDNAEPVPDPDNAEPAPDLAASPGSAPSLAPGPAPSLAPGPAPSPAPAPVQGGFAAPAFLPPGFAAPAFLPPGFAVDASASPDASADPETSVGPDASADPETSVGPDASATPAGSLAPAAAAATAAWDAADTASAAPATCAASTVAVAATSSTPHHHPPYEEMILSAIQALKDSKGSSREAISNYIAENYSDLPPDHAIFLTHHLEHLLSKGIISMLEFSYKLAHGSKKRGRPRKTAAHPGTPAATSEPKRRGRPLKLRYDTSLLKKKKPSWLPKFTSPLNPASVRIIPQVRQLKLDLLQNFPGAAAIVLPKSLLTEKAAKNAIVIFPNVIQTLIDASTVKKKPGRPRSVGIKEKPVLSTKVGKRKRGRPRKRSVVLNQGLVGVGEGQYNREAPVRTGPGRPWKIRDMLVPGNVNSVIASGEETAVGKLEPEIQKKSEELGMPESIHRTENAANLNVKKRPVGRPRKKPYLEGLNPSPAV